MTTLKRELRTKIKDVLDAQGIYTEPVPPMPSIVDLLADAVLGISAFRQISAAERYKKQSVGKDALEMARLRLMLSERIEGGLGITPDLKDKNWERVLNRIINAEENGDSFEKYVKWFKAGNEFNRPKTFQIVKNPNIIFGNWKEAQMFQTEEAPKPDEGGGIYV